MSGGWLSMPSMRPVEESGAVVLVAFDGVVALASQDRDELGAGVEEPASFADRLEVAVERRGSCAVSVAEQPSVVSGEASHVGALDRGGKRLAGPVAGFDSFGDAEVLVGHGAIRDPGVDQGHAHRAMPEQGGDRFETHPTVDRLRRQRVAQLVGMDVPDACTFRDGDHVAVDRAPIHPPASQLPHSSAHGGWLVAGTQDDLSLSDRALLDHQSQHGRLCWAEECVASVLVHRCEVWPPFPCQGH